MDKIYLNQLAFYGYHGLLPEEKKLGQRFIVDIILYLPLSQAGQSDDMNDSIHYGEVFEHVKSIMEGSSINLLERVAELIANDLLDGFDLLEACQVKVIKPDPPIPGQYESVAIEIYRERQ